MKGLVNSQLVKHLATSIFPACVVLLACTGLATAQIYGPSQTQTYAPARLLQKVGINQKMGAQIPLDLPFVDESGKDVTLRQYFGKPVILALVYYQCPSLCNMVLNGVLRSIKSMDLTAGSEYEVIAVSFDPRETPNMAAAKKQTYLKDYKRLGAEEGWHFLTGPETSSKALADAVGFRYVYDAMTNQYAHSSAIMILTPAGRIPNRKAQATNRRHRACPQRAGSDGRILGNPWRPGEARGYPPCSVPAQAPVASPLEI
jgi:protein SCO1